MYNNVRCCNHTRPASPAVTVTPPVAAGPASARRLLSSSTKTLPILPAEPVCCGACAVVGQAAGGVEKETGGKVSRLAGVFTCVSSHQVGPPGPTTIPNCTHSCQHTAPSPSHSLCVHHTLAKPWVTWVLSGDQVSVHHHQLPPVIDTLEVPSQLLQLVLKQPGDSLVCVWWGGGWKDR